MADITGNVTGVTSWITDAIVWLSTIFAKLVSSIGMREIVIFVLIIGALYFWANQHSLEPRRYAKF